MELLLSLCEPLAGSFPTHCFEASKESTVSNRHGHHQKDRIAIFEILESRSQREASTKPSQTPSQHSTLHSSTAWNSLNYSGPMGPIHRTDASRETCRSLRLLLPLPHRDMLRRLYSRRTPFIGARGVLVQSLPCRKRHPTRSRLRME